MQNFIELNLKNSRTSLLNVDNRPILKPFKPLKANMSLYPDEKRDHCINNTKTY